MEGRVSDGSPFIISKQLPPPRAEGRRRGSAGQRAREERALRGA